MYTVYSCCIQYVPQKRPSNDRDFHGFSGDWWWINGFMMSWGICRISSRHHGGNKRLGRAIFFGNFFPFFFWDFFPVFWWKEGARKEGRKEQQQQPQPQPPTTTTTTTNQHQPTKQPTNQPSNQPTNQLTNQPTIHPSIQPQQQQHHANQRA